MQSQIETIRKSLTVRDDKGDIGRLSITVGYDAVTDAIKVDVCVIAPQCCKVAPNRISVRHYLEAELFSPIAIGDRLSRETATLIKAEGIVFEDEQCFLATLQRIILATLGV